MLSGGGPALVLAICWSSRPRVDPHPARPDQVGARRPPPFRDPFRGRYDRGAALLRSYAIVVRWKGEVLPPPSLSRKADGNSRKNHVANGLRGWNAMSERLDTLFSRRACLPLFAGSLVAWSRSAPAQGSASFDQWGGAFHARAQARGISDATYTRG